MAANRCPLCESPCIIKIISTGDERYCEVDVCKICGAMYPREGRPKARAKASKKPAKKPAKRARRK